MKFSIKDFSSKCDHGEILDGKHNFLCYKKAKTKKQVTTIIDA